ncbi:MAG: outer membrane lipoprotein-sorting protein [Candidatus Cloacimonetes bacterium]|nr:outer membrane lipoprotein-sorting protein [Candidatus Cloacimonadota bacterium]
MKYKRIIALALFTLVIAGLSAQDITGLQIIENVYNRPSGQDQAADLKMTLENSRGDQRIREIKQFLKDFGELEKKIMFFVSPADVYNTSFMNWSYEENGRDDDQWIFLPALNRVKRISSDSKSDYFMGSDFTYDDMGDRRPGEDTHKLLRVDTIDGVDYYVVESVPLEEDYMYSRTVSWINGERWFGLKKEFYDEDGELLKILSVIEVQEINGYDIITISEMHNVQSDHKTRMVLTNVQVDTGVADSQFTERMMKRGL